ncbi:MAG TPA: type II toxin-antitoxin system RelE/ParE family toxin [Spirochaetota bacterium]|jgi:mRNA-degrading endonuclease RelE of RelBE toxin-antitoxin system|nr:MAG: hypothetical protein BWY90_00842 [Deltaproteobacteria bacterium ADurb.BinA014]HPM34486.1 type II toxin-antitoxin system RelE/ParE family toxin [Spirochaetota bacterium]
MSWKINYSNQAQKFRLKNPQLTDQIKDALSAFIKKISGEIVSIDVKKMKGNWEGAIRIRKGDFRIIVTVYDESKILHVQVIDFRGDVYK